MKRMKRMGLGCGFRYSSGDKLINFLYLIEYKDDKTQISFYIKKSKCKADNDQILKYLCLRYVRKIYKLCRAKCSQF